MEVKALSAFSSRDALIFMLFLCCVKSDVIVNMRLRSFICFARENY